MARNQIQVLCKGSECSQPLNQLSSTRTFFLKFKSFPHTYACMHSVCMWLLMEAKSRHCTHWSWSSGQLWTTWCWRQNPGPLQELQALQSQDLSLQTTSSLGGGSNKPPLAFFWVGGADTIYYLITSGSPTFNRIELGINTKVFRGYI